MNDVASGNLDLDDDDRLPWLEPAGGEDYDDSVSAGRLLGFILGGLVLLGVIVGGVYLLRNAFGSQDKATLIAAPEGDYKVPANDPAAKKFAGEGDASFATSEGIDRGGRIDPSRLPEAPVTAVSKVNGADAAAAAGAAGKVESKVADKTGEKGKAPATTPSLAAAGGPMIQLGAYGSEAIAQDSWKRLSKRFDYLAALNHSVQPVTVGGTKFYRLRAAAGADAGTLCGKLKVAGESCLVVN
tara:strand:+ start:25704 stop:26429 length:726 start_codon:yes stop_codon:yes gene_type:complete